MKKMRTKFWLNDIGKVIEEATDLSTYKKKIN